LDWSLVYDGCLEGWQFHQCSLRGTTVVRVRRERPLPLEHWLPVMRPEFRNSAARGDTGPFQFRLVELLAPGDALLELAALSEAMGDVEKQAYRMLGLLFVSTDLTQPSLVRSALWRDFPQAGQFSSVSVYCDRELVPPRTQGGFACYECATSVHGSRTLVEQFVQIPWPTLPAWGPPLLKGTLDSFTREWTALTRPESIAMAESTYIIANLRSCTRGPPLLPVLAAGEDERVVVQIGGCTWAAPRPGEFSFPRYMQNLLAFVDFHARCFDRLDGWRVVPYQAVIDCADWEKAQQAFHELFRVQRSAYRHMYGGKSAPKVHFGASPSFTDLCSEGPLPIDHVVQRKTFVEWAQAQRSEPRSAEYP